MTAPAKLLVQFPDEHKPIDLLAQGAGRAVGDSLNAAINKLEQTSGGTEAKRHVAAALMAIMRFAQAELTRDVPSFDCSAVGKRLSSYLMAAQP